MTNAGTPTRRGRPTQPLPPDYGERAPALAAAESRLAELHTEYETQRLERNRLVRQAVADGWTHAQIAEATGLTRSRVGQIALT